MWYLSVNIFEKENPSYGPLFALQQNHYRVGRKTHTRDSRVARLQWDTMSRAPRQKRQADSATLAHTPEDTMLKVPCTGKENRMTYSTDGIILVLRLPP